MSEHLTKKEMRTDGFAIAVEHNVAFLSDHRKQLIRYGGIALAVLLLGFGIYFYRNYQATVRQERLADAIQIQETPVTPNLAGGSEGFTTDAAKRDAATKAFSSLAADSAGSREGLIAEYYLACIAADAGKLDEARKRFQTVADGSDKNYASVAKYSLADVDFMENRGADGEKLLRELVDHPTVMVSKDQSTIALARYVGKTKPADARKLLEPIARGGNAGSQAAITALGELK